MRLPMILVLPLLAVGCGAEESPEAPAAGNVAEFENRLEALAARTVEDVTPTRRLTFLQATDLGIEMRANPACRLFRDDRLLLVVNAAGAVARIDGRRVPLTVAGPVGPTGGYFEAPGVTVSIGRDASHAGAPADAADAPTPAQATIGGDEERAIEKEEAYWACTGYSRGLPAAGAPASAPEGEGV